MRPTFRDTADKNLSELRFTENMQLSVIVRGRRRVHYTRRIVAAAAAMIIILVGLGAFLSFIPDGTPDQTVTSQGDPYSPLTYSSDNFDVLVTDFDHSGMYIDLSYTLISRARHDVLVIRSPFYDDELKAQDEVIITETCCEPEFPAYAEQAILLPAGGRLSFDMQVSLSSWNPGEEALPTISFGFIEPALDITTMAELTLTESPLLIKLDDIHVDIARASTQKTDNTSTVIREDEQLMLCNWPSDDWSYRHGAGKLYIDRDYTGLSTLLTNDGIAINEGEAIEVTLSLNNQPETLTVMCEENIYNSAAAAAFSKKYPGVQLLRIDPGSDVTPDIIITHSGDHSYIYAIRNGDFIPYADESRALASALNKMYPSVVRAVSSDNPAAFPVAMGVETAFSYNPSGFIQLGLENDVPETWLDLLKLLQQLPEYNADNYFVSAFPWQMSADEVKRAVFDNLIYACAIELAREGEEFSSDHRYFQRLILEFEKIDFDAICFPVGSPVKSSGAYLLDLHGVVDPTVYTHNDSMRPMPLALFSGFSPVVNGSLYAAFIPADCDSYPYAIRYLEYLYKNRDSDFDPEFIASFEAGADAKDITPESLAWYRGFMEYMRLTPATLDAEVSRTLYDKYFYTDK